MILSMVVAAGDDNVIGSNNTLPWHIPGDLKYFKNLTWGTPILMGRKTFESIGKPLPGRHSIVITRNKDWQYAGVESVLSLDAAVAAATARDVNELFVIGGAEIFTSALPLARRIYLTRIFQHYDGDTFFPSLGDDWKLVREKVVEAEGPTPGHSFQLWEREAKEYGDTEQMNT